METIGTAAGGVKMVPEKPHKVTIDSRERTVVTGVIDLDSMSESELIFLTTCGSVTLTGFDLHITRLDLAEGLLTVTGKVQAIDYADHEELRRNGKFIKKVFR